MRLRAKVLLTTIAVMALGYVIVTLASVAQIMASARNQNVVMARRLFVWAVQSDPAAKPARLQEHLNTQFHATGLVTKWTVVDEEGVVIAAENPALLNRPYRVIPDGAMIGAAADAGGAERRLYGNVSPGDFDLAGHLSALAPAMFLMAVLLAVILWAILSRQVLTPVVELAEASRLVASGARTAPARGALRRDEIGELVRAFNRMAEEVAESRRDLERRVAEATEKSRRAQEAANIAQRLAATGKLAAGVAHEINNPLGGMVNAARLLEKSVPAADARGREYLALISEGLERVGRIVGKLLRFQRSKTAGSTTGPVDVAEALESALRFAEHRLKGVELVRELPPGLPTVLGVRQELDQVFLNLVLNAADAVKDSATRRIAVRARAEDSGRKVVVEIEDSGCGMTPEEAQAAFDLFHTTKGEGTGLGLPVAHSIVQSHGGELALESAKGRGTKAIVRLPAGGKTS